MSQSPKEPVGSLKSYKGVLETKILRKNLKKNIITRGNAKKETE